MTISKENWGSYKQNSLEYNKLESTQQHGKKRVQNTKMLKKRIMAKIRGKLESLGDVDINIIQDLSKLAEVGEDDQPDDDAETSQLEEQ